MQTQFQTYPMRLVEVYEFYQTLEELRQLHLGQIEMWLTATCNATRNERPPFAFPPAPTFALHWDHFLERKQAMFSDLTEVVNRRRQLEASNGVQTFDVTQRGKSDKMYTVRVERPNQYPFLIILNGYGVPHLHVTSAD